jgi:hypothetical protein
MEELEKIYFQQFGVRRNLSEETQKLTHIFHFSSYFIISHSFSSKIIVPNIYGIR